MIAQAFRLAIVPAALAAGLLCLPACGKKKDTGSDSSGGDTKGTGNTGGPPGPTGGPPGPTGGATDTDPRGATSGTAPVSGPRDRERSLNNLKMLGLALHFYHDSMNHFPAGIADRSGKVGLSWRVQILPYIEQAPLYQKFKLDEPWDSPANKSLIDQMPNVYASPGKAAPAGQTYYRGFTGPNAVFFAANPKGFAGQPLRGRGITSITDGTSNTLLVVEAGEPVPWTKPDELVYNPKGPVPKLGGVFSKSVLKLGGRA